jgi:2-dehydro-3-deoxygalactonokinase
VSATALLGLDWGTTSARAYRIGADGAVLDTRSGPYGVQQVRDGEFEPALAALLGDWAGLAVPRLACGMIGSRQGWREAPYCSAPASVADLARGVVRVGNPQLHIVPGVSTRDAAGVPDVMRGEETQILGAVGDAADAVVVLPGTHSKWAHVRAGRIESFVTYLTGELYAALLDHTILGRLATAAAQFDAQSFARGAGRGLAGGALAHDVFGARTLALFGELAAAGVADWLSGLLIGAEIAAARNAAPGVGSVHVVATDALAMRYRAALAQAGWRAVAAPDHAAAHGLWRLACHAGLVAAPAIARSGSEL